jgi:hypothetical protein
MLVIFGVPDTYGGGPCNAGLGLLAYSPALLISLILVLVSAAFLLSKGRSYLSMFLVNFVGFCALVTLVFVRF